MPGQKRLFVKTFGCQMNAYDSERMADALSPFGFIAADGPNDADVIILNTCHIREKAAEKVYSELGRIRKIKAERQQSGAATQVVVAGCVAQAEGAEIIRRAPVVDLVVGPQNYHRLPDLLFRARQEGRHLVDTEFADESKFASLPKRSLSRTCSAFLTIQEGCDKFCTFCVVPYTRGMEFSRPVSQILDEAKTLIDGGVCEITLLGQNVNAYHGRDEAGRDCTLAGLIERLSAIVGIERLRYTTSHPSDMSDDLIEAHGSNGKLMPYLHLPFQTGSDRMLAAMNRRHTRQHYLDIVAKIRAARPDIALSTDIIVGFPGESDEDFLETLDVVREVNFAQAYSFKYSARPGTPAAGMPDQVADAVKSERLGRLQSLLSDQQKQFNTMCVGATLPVLFEKTGRHDGQLVGRSPYLQPVHAEGIETLIGQLRDVEIQAAGPNSLSGVIIQASQAGMQVHSGV